MNGMARLIDIDELKEQLLELPSTRGFRLLAIGLLAALFYPQARLLWLIVLGVAYFWPVLEGIFHAWKTESIREGYELVRKRLYFAPVVVLVLAFGGVLFVFSLWDLHQTRLVYDEFLDGLTIEQLHMKDGTDYPGHSYGFRGPVLINARFSEGKLAGVEIIKHSDSLSVGRHGMEDMVLRLIEAEGRGEAIAEVDAISGATHSSLAMREAVMNALYEARGKRHLSFVSKAVFWGIGNDWSRFVFSASAIIFIIGLLFEFCLAPFLRREAGVTLPCYNCQTCVGACPVKMVEDVPYPMGMILEMRLGNYERAAELGKYCVGCSQCASKCPIGISGPIVASQAQQMVRADARKARRKAEARKEAAGDE